MHIARDPKGTCGLCTRRSSATKRPHPSLQEHNKDSGGWARDSARTVTYVVQADRAFREQIHELHLLATHEECVLNHRGGGRGHSHNNSQRRRHAWQYGWSTRAEPPGACQNPDQSPSPTPLHRVTKKEPMSAPPLCSFGAPGCSKCHTAPPDTSHNTVQTLWPWCTKGALRAYQ